MKPVASQPKKYLRALPVFGIFAGGAAYSLLPSGMFAENDVLFRALIVGTVAAMSTLLLAMIIQRKRSDRIENRNTTLNTPRFRRCEL